MSETTLTAPQLTAEQVQRILVQPLDAASTFLAAGPRIFDVTAAGPVRIPKLLGTDEPGWHGESEQITEVEAEFTEIVLLDGVKSLKAITRVSNELMRSSVVALDSVLRDRLVGDVARKIDRAFYAGDGATDAQGLRTPLGLLNQPGIIEHPVDGPLSLDDLLDAIGLLMAANVDPTRCRVFMRSSTFVALRKVKTTDGKFLLQPDPTADGVFRLLGLGVTITNRLPVNAGATSVVVADMSKVAVARDMSPTVTVLRERYADYDETGLRVVGRYDVGVLNGEAVVVLTGVTG
jgi:HK97 family phage major capsid protein